MHWGSILSCFFFAMPQANKTKEIIGLRPMIFFKLVQCPRVWFFWGWYLKDSDVMHCSAPYSMKTFTLPAAYASKRVAWVSGLPLFPRNAWYSGYQKSNNDHCHNLLIIFFNTKSSSFSAVYNKQRCACKDEGIVNKVYHKFTADIKDKHIKFLSLWLSIKLFI